MPFHTFFTCHIQIGKAQTIKIVNNLSESINLLGAAEIVNLGIQLGCDIETLKKVLPTTRGYSVYMGVLFEYLTPPSEDVSASLEVRLKDIEIAQHLADHDNQWIPLGSMAKELFKLSINLNGKEADQTKCFNIFCKLPKQRS